MQVCVSHSKAREDEPTSVPSGSVHYFHINSGTRVHCDRRAVFTVYTVGCYCRCDAVDTCVVAKLLLAVLVST